MARPTGKVCIMWRLSPRATAINVLTYGNGEIRTYEPDAIDARAHPDVFVNTLAEAIDALRPGDERKVAVPVAIARRIGTSDWRFAE